MLMKLQKIEKVAPQTNREKVTESTLQEKAICPTKPSLNRESSPFKPKPVNASNIQLTLDLNKQIEEKLKKKQAEQYQKKVPDIEGNLGYPPIKNLEKEEIKNHYYQVYKQHQLVWEQQIKEKRELKMEEKKNLEEYRKRLEQEASNQYAKKSSKSMDLTNIWALQSHINKINKREASVDAPEKEEAVFLTSILPSHN